MTELVDKLSVFLIRRSNFASFINLKSQHEFKVIKKTVRCLFCKGISVSSGSIKISHFNNTERFT